MHRKACVLLVGFVVAAILPLSLVLAQAVSSPVATPAWASPNAVTLKKLGITETPPAHPAIDANLDCQASNYILASDGLPHSGCLAFTALGFMDLNNSVVLFSGAPTALQLTPYSAHEALLPWPGTLDVLALDAAANGGSYMSLYTDISANMSSQTNILGRTVGKQVSHPPTLHFNDPSGQPLVVNPASLAFSDGGSWLVAETLNGSFVRLNLATLDIVPFAPSFIASGNALVGKSQVAVSRDGHYVAVENTVADSFKVYDLTACSAATVTNLVPLSCPSHEYWPTLAGQLGTVQSLSDLDFVNDGLLSFNANGYQYELAPTDHIANLSDYLGLGDSYTSGEGALNYLAGTDTSDNMCHLSLNSYPLLLTRDLFTAAGGHSVACSGARMQDIVPSSASGYPGQVKNGLAESKRSADDIAQLLANFSPGYLPQADFVSQYLPSALTVSVGGDDVGFGDIVQNCVEPHLSLHASSGVCYATYEDRQELIDLINRNVPRWVSLYKQLLKKAPGTTLYAIGYPQIAVDNGSCGSNVLLNVSELEFAEELINYLNGAIASAAVTAGAQYVDISQALAGHRLCEASGYDIAVNGLTAGTDGGLLGVKLFGKASYHPNALGQELIEQAILKQTHNLQLKAVSTAPTNDTTGLLNAPKTGRAINSLVPDDTITTSVVTIGTGLPVTVNGVLDGLQPGATFVVHLDGTNGEILGSLSSDQDGNLSGAVTLPASVTPGGHKIDIIGAGQGGQPVDVTEPIYITDGSDETADSGSPASNPASNSAAPANLSNPSGSIDSANSIGVVGVLKPSSSIGAVLSASTTNPTEVRQLFITPAEHIAKGNKTIPAPGHMSPRIIEWLPWLGLYVLLWLLFLVATYWLRRSLKSRLKRG